MISLERDEKELNASLSVHLDTKEVAQAFQLEKPVPRRGVGPLQPNPYPLVSAWAACGLAFALCLTLFVVHQVTAEDRQALFQTVQEVRLELLRVEIGIL